MPWRFDIARNISLSHVPEDVDVCVCTDLDERFIPGWRSKLESAWIKSESDTKVSRTGRYLYNWSLKADGAPDVQFHYFKVHERTGFRWKCPVHEYIEYVGSAPLQTIYIEGMVLNHYPDAGKSLSSYLHMPSSAWKDERCAAMRWIAKSYQMLGLVSNAYCWYFNAIAEQPEMRDAFVEFARLCMLQKDWPMTYFLSKEALKIVEKSKTFVNMGYSWDYTPDDICAISAYYMGMYSEAKAHAASALKFDPMNERLINNLRLCGIA